MTSIVTRCTIALPILFWQLVNLSVFAYSMAFLFWPTDSAKLFLSAPDTELIRFIGVQFLLVSAGTNQMMASASSSDVMRKSSYITSVFEYLLGGIAGIVVLSFKEEPFIETQRYAFIILFSLFTAFLALTLCGGCGTYCTIRTKSSDLDSIAMEPVRRTNPIPRSRAEILQARR
tara:strand:- start:1608 stop:2132 length:525 start_codon:yes stop_codon:yes gene_type:complete